MKSRVGKELRITWVDAKMWGNAWMDNDEVSDMRLPVCRSRGLVVKDTEEMILLAQNDSKDGIPYSNLTAIPKGCILNTQVLK